MNAMHSLSPYRAVAGCDHRVIVNRTCGFQPVPWLNDAGQVDCGFNVRAWQFECADCGASVWPVTDEQRRSARASPVCTAPICDCDYIPDDSRIPAQDPSPDPQ